MIGQTVSHYRILEKLGEGGMGVVYKAHDTKLNRDVALKFLPHGLSAHEPERARFLQEAQAAAALNHPNICTIHDIAQEGDDQFIVMEYVDGVMLRQKIAAGRMQIADCIGYAIQIGDALQEAHGKGIVHRDIKAENIMVNSKNQIKVMDFGLAKLKGSLKLTKTSSTVGTLAYMAPEQIQGGEVDARSDIFSFGVVLYEMLTGHMPFRGDHEAAVMYSIVNEEPTPLQQYLPEVSSELVHIMNRALEKDPEDRYQSVHDLVIDLRRLKKETTRVVRSAEVRSETSTMDLGGRWSRRKRRLAAALALAAIALCAIVLILVLPHRPVLNPDMQFRVVQLPFRNVSYAGMSHDGNWFVFPAADNLNKFDIYMMNAAGGEPRRITADSCYAIFGVDLSDDGSTIVYSRRRSSPADPWEVVSVSSLGGTGRVIVEGAYAARWLEGGRRVGYVVHPKISGGNRITEYWSCAPDGSDRKLEIADTVVNRPGLRTAACPSPDRKYIAWTKNFPEGYSEIMIRDRAHGTDRQLTHDRKFADDPVWSHTGTIFYSSNRGGNVNIWMVPESGGDPVQVTRGSGPDAPMGLTADGKRLMYAEVQDIGQVRMASLVDGSVRQLTVDERQRGRSSISPSGKLIAFPAQENDAMSSARNIYIMDRDGGAVRKLTDDMSHKDNSAWSRDEKWISYTARLISESEDSSRIYVLQADKPGQPKLLGKGSFSCWINDHEVMIWSFAGSYRRSIDKDESVKVGGDSLYVMPVVNEKYVLFLDWHSQKLGWWISSAATFSQSGPAAAVRLTRGISYGYFHPPYREMFYVPLGSGGELHRISLPEGKDQVVRKVPGLGVFFSTSADAKDLVFTEYYRTIRFVVIDNLFKQ